MTSTAWAEAIFAVVLLAPIAALVVAFAVAAPRHDHRWATAGCAISAAGSTVLLVAGQRPHVGGFAPDDLALAACAATAIVALAVDAAARPPILGLIVTAACAGVAVGSPGRPSIVAAVVGLAIATALLAVTVDAIAIAVVSASAAVVVIATGVHVGGTGGANAVMLGAAAAVAVVGFAARRSATVVLPVALTLGLRIAPDIAVTPAHRPVALVLAIAATGLVATPLVTARLRIAAPAPATAVALWALAAAVGPFSGAPAAALLLAGGAVLAVTVGGDLALVAAVPGVAVLAHALVDTDGWPRTVFAVLALTTIAALVGRPARSVPDATRRRPRAIDGVGLVLIAWIVLRPTSWAWARPSHLEPYDEGAVLALAALLIGGVLTTLAGGRLDWSPMAEFIAPSRALRAGPSTRGRVMLMIGATLMGLAAAALVRSASL